jgi:protocatechuate 4,5-dioxygenase alpha subunit
MTKSAAPESVDLCLDAPSAYLFTGEICTRAYRLNKFAFDFKYPAVRERFASDPEALMSEYGLSEREKALVRTRDWTGLVASGGHHFNVIKIAAAVGESHLHVGAHMCGANWDEFKQTLPHRIELMPQDLRDGAANSERGAPAASNRAPSDSGASRDAGRED